jgi:uncharacterized glyoxalase superfamily protein PhnB
MSDERFRARLRSAVPVFLVSDIATTIQWYATHLGFEANTFPKTPPYAFCILIRGGVEIMLQGLAGYEKPCDFGKRASGVWDAYLRIQGVAALYEAMSKASDVKVLEPLKKQWYGDTEFVVEDPNGYVLVFSEQI